MTASATTLAGNTGSARAISAGLRQIGPPAALLAGLVLAWQLLVTLADVPPYLLPGPSAIAGQVHQFFGSIVDTSVVTGTNALLGLAIGSIGAVVVAVAAASFRALDLVLAPLVTALAVVPIVALAPVLYSMYGTAGEQGRVIVAALAAFVPVYVTTLRGLRQVLPVHRDLMAACAASRTQIAVSVTLPTAVPHVFTGLRLAASLAVIAAIVAEYFGGPKSGIGSAITTAAAGSQYSRSWAYVLGGIVVGLVFFAATSLCEFLATRRGGAN